MDAGGAWPADLQALVGLAPIRECLAGLGIDSLESFADEFDLEEGHEAAVQAALAALPTKPKKARQQRNRAQKAFADLVQRLRAFEEFDADDDGFLSRVECMRIPPERMRAKAGGTIAERFDAIDADRDGNITFAELFVAAELVGEQAEVGVPPSPPTRGVSEHEPRPEAQATIQLWVKAPDGGALKVTAKDGLATTVAQVRRTAAEAARVDVASCRLIFAGKQLEDRMSLADYSCQNASELHLILRVEEDDASADREAEQQTARVRSELVGKRLADFIVSKKIGGKDIAAVGGGGAAQSVSQSGVCSYVYLAVRRGARGGGEPAMQFAIKVMLNYEEGMGNSVAIRQEFDAETALLSDPERLPAHRHVMVVLHSFTDSAAGLPSWNFESDIVNPRTMFVVMPYYPDDLKRVFRKARREGSRLFGALRAVRIVSHLLQAIRHLKSHGIVHRDVKLDNVLIASPGTAVEAAVLTDFGMCLDLTKNRIVDFRVPMPYDGIRRGGAPIALAPEVTLPKPGPDVFLDYSKNDEWAVGMIAHELLSQEGCSPFPDMEHPATYSDTGYQQETIPQVCQSLVCGLLRTAVPDRLDAIEGCRRAKRLEQAVSEDAEIAAAEAAARGRVAAEEEAASLALARRLQEEEEAAAARARAAPERQAPEAEPEPQQAQRCDAAVKLTNETIREAVRAFCDEGGGKARATFADSPDAAAKYGPVSSWDVSGVTDMAGLFEGMKAFNQPLGEWSVDQVTDMYGMFRGAAAFNQPLGEWSVGQVRSMGGMFEGAAAFNQPLGEWSVDQVRSMSAMFKGAAAFNQPLGEWSVGQVTNMSYMFDGAAAFNQPLGEWSVGQVTDMRSMFEGAAAFNQPLGEWSVDQVTDMSAMFEGAAAFNQPIGEWSVDQVTNMNFMFRGAAAFNQPLGEWSVDQVTNMSSMFRGAAAFNQPIGEWRVGQVTNMRSMFDGAAAFNQPIGEWSVDQVTDMRSMFDGAAAFNQPIGEWSVDQVTDMSAMFEGAAAFNQSVAWRID